MSTTDTTYRTTYITTSENDCYGITCASGVSTDETSISMNQYDEWPDPVDNDRDEDDKFRKQEIREQNMSCWIQDTHFAMSIYTPKPSYHRQLLFSLSGWLAPPGKLKRTGKCEGRN